ncbi:MAG: hypothetical protein QW158_00600 [Nitrososphaerales archaeon]
MNIGGKSELRIKSLPSMVPSDTVESKLIELGFKLHSEATIVSDDRFWRRRLYINGQEVVSVSDEIGRFYHLRDPIVTICGKKETIEALCSIL